MMFVLKGVHPYSAYIYYKKMTIKRNSKHKVNKIY